MHVLLLSSNSRARRSPPLSPKLIITENLTVAISLAKFVLAPLLLLGSSTLGSQNPADKDVLEHRLEHLTINDGLPDNSVHCIFQDHLGYFWFGTRSGLVRYDGFTMKVYQPDPEDSLSISHPWVRTIHEDRSGMLWVGTDGGLNRFGRTSETFTRYRNPQFIIGGEANRFDRKTETPVHSNFLIGTYDDAAGNIWVATDRGLYLFDPHSEDFQQFAFGDSLFRRIYSMVGVRTTDVLYFGTNKGLYSFELTGRTFKKFDSDGGGLGHVFSLHQTSDGRIYMGGQKGLAVLDPTTGQIKHYEHDPRAVKELVEDATGLIWCYAAGATNSEVMIFDPVKDKLVQQWQSDRIYAMQRDRSGIVWLATMRNGLTRWDKNRWKFKLYQHEPGEQNSISDNLVTSVCVDSDGIVWAGTVKGLDRIDQSRGTVKHYPIRNNEVTAVCQDRSGYLWVGTLNGGLVKFDPTRETSVFYSHDPNDKTSLSSNHVFVLTIDRHGILWVGTRDNGLNRFSEEGKSFTRYLHDPTRPGSLSNNGVFFIYEDSDGVLWVVTEEGGLNKYDRKSGNFTSFVSKDELGFGIGFVFEDMAGNCWLGTYAAGLHLFDKRKLVSVKSFTQKDGLADNSPVDMFEDGLGNLWVNTFSGLSRFNPQTQTFRNFNSSDGLPGNMSSRFISFKDSRGEVFFGSYEGLVSFHPDSIRDDPVPPQVVISNVSLFNRPGEALKYEGFIPEVEELDLPYNHNDLRFDYVGLHYGEPAKNRYMYMLENFDEEWVDAGTQRNATYTNLDPGEYTFRVKACNRDGVWNAEGASIRLIITPPYWATWWAYGIYVVLFGSVFYGIRRYEMNRLNWKNQVRLDEVKLKEKEETDTMKSRFFANISHEFRTPLTLILGPTEKIMDRIQDEEVQKQGGVIKRNAGRLLGLVNQLLDLSRLEAGKLRLEASRGNIVSFVRGVAMSFESLAERKGIQLKVHSSGEEIEMYFDRDKMAKILTNLLSNAFKFTPDGGTVTVSLSLKNLPPFTEQVGQAGASGNDHGVLAICVADTGVGIPTEELSKLFDRFYQVDSSQTREHEGTGIGLALTKELVELHHGSITVASKAGEGSEFTVEFPLGRGHLHDDEIVKDARPVEQKVMVDADDYDTSAPHPTVEETEREAQEKTIVLVVEDNAEVRQYIRESLGDGYQVEEAANGEQGVKKAEELIPDLIISDIMMPKMDGNELTRRIKNDERTSHIPVILLTARSEQESRLQGLETGADDYLTKPFDTKELQVRIRNLVKLRKSLQEKYTRADFLGKKDRAKLSSLDEIFMKKVNEVIEHHISEEEFTIEQFDQELGMGRVQIYRKLRALTGNSPSRYIRRVRLVRARKMIIEKKGNISEIAYSLGFGSPTYFTRCFKEEFSCLPSDLTQRS